MTELVLASLVLLGLHAIPSTPLRSQAIARLGRPGFLIAFSAASTASLIWIWFAYQRAAQEIETIYWMG